MKPRVLVVDDDRLVADTLNLVLSANGFECETAYSVAEGLELARSFLPGLLLCDVMMPVENGLQLVKKLRIEMPECQTLMISAYASPAVWMEMQAMQLERPLKVLQKPCRPDDLVREASALLMTA